MKHQNLINDLRDELAILVNKVEGATAMQLYDLNRLAENVVLGLFQEILNLPQLRNLNATERESFPGIDLADDTERLAVQVTATTSLEKIKDTLSTFQRHNLNKSYDRLVVYVLTHRQNTYSQSSINAVVRGRFNFNAKDDIFDFRYLLKKAAHLPPAKVKAAVEVLKSYNRDDEPPHAKKPTWFFNYRKSPKEITPFSPPWFVFTERSIKLIGRDAELDSLTQFLNHQELFSWWTICGPAGIGKSRLAQELSMKFDLTWDCGFVDMLRVEEIRASLSCLRQPTFLVIDYASRQLASVETILKSCCSFTAGLQHKVRILLLEREADHSAEWWRTLLASTSANALMLSQYQYAAPLNLSVLSDYSHPIMEAWLTAGAPHTLVHLPPQDAPFWAKLNQMTEGRPLLIGIVAAAFAHKPESFEILPMDRLLHPILSREVLRWRESSPSPEEFTSVVSLIGVATLLRGLPLPTEESLVACITEETRELLLLKDEKTGLYEIPSLKWLNENAPHLLPSTEIEHQHNKIVSLLGAMIPPDKVDTCLSLVQNLCPPAWTLQPDLIGEFFLDELWGKAMFYNSARVLPYLDDSLLQRQLLVAWRISPHSVLNTLSQLKNSTSSPPAYVRALILLTSAISAGEPTSDEAMQEFSRLLYNAIVRIGNNKTSTPLLDQLSHALTQLAVEFPENNDIAYRHLKGLSICASRLKGADQLAVCTELLTRSPKLIAEMKANSLDHFELYWADNLTRLIKDAWEKRDGELLSDVLNSAVILQSNFSSSCELYDILSKLYDWIARRLAGIDLLQDELTSDVEVLTRRFALQIEEDVYHCAKCGNGSLSQSAETNLAWSLINISFAYSKIGDIEHTVDIRSHIERACESLGVCRTYQRSSLKYSKIALSSTISSA
ncbi:MAG: SMEK domain-containing protein [Methylobacter sp.]